MNFWCRWFGCLASNCEVASWPFWAAGGALACWLRCRRCERSHLVVYEPAHAKAYFPDWNGSQDTPAPAQEGEQQ